MKNLNTLGAYIDSLIEKSAAGVANRAAKILNVSPAELHALRNGTRQSPNPIILKKISEILGGDYRMLFELAGYEVPGKRPTITHIPVLSKVEPGIVLEKNILYFEDVPSRWLNSGNDYFGFREYSLPGSQIPFYYLINKKADFEDGDQILVSWDNMPAKIMLAYRLDVEKIELLGAYTCERKVIIDPVIFGIVEMGLIDRGKRKK